MKYLETAKRVEESDVYLILLSEDYHTNLDCFEQDLYAKSLNKPFLIIKERENIPIPDHIKDADILEIIIEKESIEKTGPFILEALEKWKKKAKETKKIISGKVRRCTISKENFSYKKCDKAHFATARVRIFHPDTNRRTWQTWYFCKEHFNKFKKDNGEGWGCMYRNEKRPFSPVMEYKII